MKYRGESVLNKIGQRVGSPIVSNAVIVSLHKTMRKEHAKALARPDYDERRCKAVLWHQTKGIIGKFNVTERDVLMALDEVLPNVRLDKKMPISSTDEKLSGVWSTLKKYWPTMSLWQKAMWALFFPITISILALVVWRERTYDSDGTQQHH